MPDRPAARPTPRPDLVFLVLVLAVAAWLRWPGLGRPLWTDEAVFFGLVGRPGSQEFVPVLAARLVGLAADLREPLWLRLPFLAAALIAIPALWLVFRRPWLRVLLGSLVATLPLFVFWSTLARPYAMAWLFMVLGWWRWPFFVPMLLCTPLAAVGLRFSRLRTRRGAAITIGLLLLAGALTLVRPDLHEGFLDWRFLVHAKRLHTLLALSLLLHLAELCDSGGIRARLRALLGLD